MSDMINNKNFQYIKKNNNEKLNGVKVDLDNIIYNEQKLKEMENTENIFDFMYDNAKDMFNDNVIFSFNSEKMFNKSMYSIFDNGYSLLFKVDDILLNLNYNDIVKINKFEIKDIEFFIKDISEKILIKFKRSGHPLYFFHKDNIYRPDHKVTIQAVIFELIKRLILNYRIKNKNIENNNINIKGF